MNESRQENHKSGSLWEETGERTAMKSHFRRRDPEEKDAILKGKASSETLPRQCAVARQEYSKKRGRLYRGKNSRQAKGSGIISLKLRAEKRQEGQGGGSSSINTVAGGRGSQARIEEEQVSQTKREE